ncbi:hypothetical protein FM104_12015 [Microbacterium esteraromaticum]|uniref:Uncharacterized protein n=1 Tax=Microbacterium esteraromaticum TaxID=57043 RepID=A0A1R4KDS2_9MICO|nr:hypothetical protein [Microbacterium esteraromaticum]SJN42521.1 hypothetical protein FM104_12015 [Microbacterium esteraromaticum]
MENPALYIILVVSLPALLVGVLTTLNAKKTNASWRARREARAHAKVAGQ